MKLETRQSYHRRIGRVIEAILADPAAPHTVESLAAVAHLSPFHFHRIYRALTGEGVAETVRRLRLAQGARQLARRAGPVTEIALDAGYDSPQSFARAFRDFTGVSPSSFQARHFPAPAVEIVEVQPFEILCLRHDGPAATIGLTYRNLFERLHAAGIALADPPPQIGLSSGDPEEPAGFTYLAGMAIEAPPGGVDGLETLRIKGGTYACHRLVGPYALIGPTFQAIFGEWLPQSGHEPDDRPALQFYRTRSAGGQRPDNVTDLMIPLKETTRCAD